MKIVFLFPCKKDERKFSIRNKTETVYVYLEVSNFFKVTFKYSTTVIQTFAFYRKSSHQKSTKS